MSAAKHLSLPEAERLMEQIADLVLPQLQGAYPAAAAHHGLKIARSSDDPYIEVVRQHGSPFTWVAFSFAGYRMWDVHVGCVLDLPQGTAQVGFHALESRWPELPEATIAAACQPLGASHVAAPRAMERQYNAPAVPLADERAAIRQLGDLVVRFYRTVAPLLSGT